MKVNDFADTLLARKLSEVTGVGLVTIQGNQKPAVRVRVNPAAIASLGLGFEDVRRRSWPGQCQCERELRRTRQAYSVGSNDQIFSAAEYRHVIVAYRKVRPFGSEHS